jgi:probable phosphoglycerate mutase
MATSPQPEAHRSAKRKAPPSTLVLLVRHGITSSTGQVLPGRAPGLHLSDAGREQAARLGERLAAWAPANGARPHITAVYASPMERTKETAAPLGRALGVRVQVARGLIECDFGDWTGSELKQLMKLPDWATIQRYPSGFRFPGGESFTGMQARMLQVIAELRAGHPGQMIVAVSHADPIKAVVAEALGTHLDLFQRIVISPCSVTAISYGAFGPTVLAVNSTGSLSDLVPS